MMDHLQTWGVISICYASQNTNSRENSLLWSMKRWYNNITCFNNIDILYFTDVEKQKIPFQDDVWLKFSEVTNNAICF